MPRLQEPCADAVCVCARACVCSARSKTLVQDYITLKITDDINKTVRLCGAMRPTQLCSKAMG